jgi:tripartite-type tricarboxylate transporter receptor subunit TctC
MLSAHDEAIIGGSTIVDRRRLLTAAASAAALCAMPLTASAQANLSYPTRPITIVVAYPPGSTSDLLARTVGDPLSARLGQPVVIDNRPGAGGNVGAAYVARAPADGYMLMVGTDAIMTSNVHLYKDTPFDSVKDFAPITEAGANIICLAVNSALPVHSVAELIDYARARQGKLSFGSSGIGSPHHLAGELLRQKAGIDIVHVPYKGGAAATNDLLGDHIDMAFLSLSAAVPQLSTGKIRILAVVEKSRYPAMPDIPTIAETVPGFEMSSWVGFFAPAATADPIITHLHDEIVRILKTDGVKDKLASLGLAVTGSTPAELAEVIRSDLELRGRLMKSAGIKPE